MNNTKFTVTVLGFNQALASAITGALDVFAFAGISWQRIHSLPTSPQFKVQLASHHGQPILCSNQVILQPNIAIEDVSHTDILLIPTIGGGTHVNGLRSGLTEALKEFCEFRSLIPKNIKLPKDQQDRDMIARELLVKFQMSPNHPLVDLKKAYKKF